MAELKTKRTKNAIAPFLKQCSEAQQQDCQELLKIFTKATRMKPALWGESIIGYGEYHYKYASGQEGNWPLTGFSPRKANISIYIMPGFSKFQDLLGKLGKHKVSKGSCLYINKLADIDTQILSDLITQSVEQMRKMYPEHKA